LQEIGCADVVLEGASFVLRDPDADKITGQVVALRQRMQGLARNVFQGDLTLEFDAVGAVLGHGCHPWRPGRFRSIPNLQSVHRLGCTPGTGVMLTGGTGVMYAENASEPSNRRLLRRAVRLQSGGPSHF